MKRQLANKRIRLALWLMLYRVPIENDLGCDRECQRSVARHLKWTMEQFDALKRDFPSYWERMLTKRRIRLEYAQSHGGNCPRGWTPPIDGEPVRDAPLFALAKRDPLGFSGVVIMHSKARELNDRARRGLAL